MPKVQWEVTGSGTIILDDCDGMTREEIKKWAYDIARMEMLEQGEYKIRLTGLDEAIRALEATLAEEDTTHANPSR